MRRFLPLILLVTFVIHSHPGLAQDASAEVVLLEDIAWSPDGTRIAGVYSDSHVAIWSVDDLSDPLLTFQAELADSVTWTADSQHLIAQGKQFDEAGLIQLSVTKWDADTGELSETMFTLEMDMNLEFDFYYFLNDALPAIAFDSTGTRAALSLRDGLVRLSDGYHILHLDYPNTTNHVRYMEWSPDNRYLAVVYGDSDTYTIQIFDVESEELTLIISQDFQYFITDLGWDASGTHLATSSMRYTCCEGWSNLGVYNIETDENLYWDADFWKTEIARYAAPIAWHPSQYILAYADEDSIEIYNPDEPKPLFTIAVNEAKDIEWSPDGTQIASISRDGALAMWDVSF